MLKTRTAGRVVLTTTGAEYDRAMKADGWLESAHLFVPDAIRDVALAVAGVRDEDWDSDDSWCSHITAAHGGPFAGVRAGDYAVGHGPGWGEDQKVAIVRLGRRMLRGRRRRG